MRTTSREPNTNRFSSQISSCSSSSIAQLIDDQRLKLARRTFNSLTCVSNSATFFVTSSAAESTLSAALLIFSSSACLAASELFHLRAPRRTLDVEVVLGVERIEEVGREMMRSDREANMIRVDSFDKSSGGGGSEWM
jgi:hypothetical protein